MPAGELTISFIPNAADHSKDHFPFVPCFRVQRDGETLSTVLIVVSRLLAQTVLLPAFRTPGSDEDPLPAVKRVLLRYGLRRLEQVLDDPASQSELKLTTIWELADDDMPAVAGLAWDKTCSYQKRDGRDLFCLTPSAKDEAASYLSTGQRAAPTSRAICRECNLPDTDYLCSHFLHPGIRAMSALSGLYQRSVAGALCDLGQQERITGEPHQCRPGGHPCWARVLSPSVPAEVPVTDPLALPEAFDAADTAWRLTFGKRHRLIRPNTAVGLASQAVACATREEFSTRAVELGDILNRLDSQSAMSEDEQAALKAADIRGALNQLLWFLEQRLAADGATGSKAAVGRLRRVVDVRDAIGHGRTSQLPGGLPQALARVGIHDAPPNWSRAWDRLRAEAIAGLRGLAAEFRRHADAE